MSGRFLWDGSDGEDPAISLNELDIHLILDALDAYRPNNDLGVVVWPTLGELQDVRHWVTRWYRAQQKWEEAREEPVDETPF